MKIKKDHEFEALDNERFTSETSLSSTLIKSKEEELKLFKEERAKVQQKFQADKDLQDCLAEEKQLREKIEDSNVNLELLNIQVKELEDDTDFLNEKKDELNEQRKGAEIKNEELKKELSAKEEIAAKRLQAKLNRDKNADVKELIAQEETAMQHNTELTTKLHEEMKKFDGLLDEKMDI